MITLKALRFPQSGMTLYLTALSLGDVRQLRKSKQLVIETFDPDRPILQGYQRGLDPKKIQQIADFVSRGSDEPGTEVLLPLMPTAIVLNSRPSPGSMLRFDENTSELTITERAILYVVDGQHRIEGITKSKLNEEDFHLPVIIVQELNMVQEAAQFLTINSKQTRVRPDLQLRVLYNFDAENTRRLVDILRVDDWKLEAQALAIALNDKNESPWRSLVRRPNDQAGGWKPMREGGFIDTLKAVCDRRGPLARVDTSSKEKFLIEYWEAIRQHYEEAFRHDTGKRYHLCRTIGAGIFHTVAPIVFHLRALRPRRSLYEMLAPLTRKARLRDWARKTGKFSREAARRSTYVSRASEFAMVIEPQLDLVNRKALSGLRRRNLSPADEKIITKAEGILRPIGYRRFDENRGTVSGQRGCYCLLKFKGDASEAYVGRADNIGERLGQHHDYDLYNFQTALSDREIERLEMTLYHLLKPEVRTNANHPPPEGACPYC